ncbi:hypothetical protein [Colwellia sp. MEBiC06753]
MGDIKNLIWCIFGLASALAFYLLDFDKINIGKYAFYFAFLSCLIYFFQLSNNSSITVNALVRYTVLEGNEAFGLASYTAISALCFSVALINNKLSYRKLFLLFSLQLLVIFIVLISGTRSPLFGLSAALMYINWRLFRHPVAISRKLNIIFFGIVAVVVCISLFDSVAIRFITFIDFLNNGLLTLFNRGGYYADAAALSRVYQREIAFEHFFNHFYFGAGFKNFWVDFPILQAFSNGGVFLGVIYFLVYFVYPFFYSLRTLFIEAEPSAVRQLIALIYIINSPRLFLHGQPYDWQHMVYVIPAIMLFSRYKRKV